MGDSSAFLSLPWCCAPVIARVEESREPRRCPVCQREHAPRDVGPVTRREGRDLRAEDPRPEPSRPREPRSSEPEGLVRVRRLLCELRPDQRGPFGWPSDGEPPKIEEPTLGALAGRIRVQCSEEVPAIPPDAFASAARSTAGSAIAARLDREELLLTHRLAHPGPRDVPTETRAALRGVVALSWLQRCGTLRAGVEALHRGLAFALGSEMQKVRWKSAAPGAARGAVAWGAARVDEAITTWEAMRW